MKTTLKATLVATAIATFPFAGQAAGLGAINVLSGLGQPLRAEIELQATDQELQSLSARVAPVESFRQASVSYSPVMTGLRFSVETRGNRSLVRVTSDRPVNEPFVDMLVELNWSGGRLVREYTFLLDPVELARPPTAAAVVATPATAAPRAAAAPRTDAPSGEYRVRRGDTLRAIANAHRPADITLDQMLVALLRQNPQAFDEGNVNRLRAGAILTIPDQASARATDSAQARREVATQAADFEAYRNRLAGAIAARPAVETPSDSRESVGEIVARVEPATAEAVQDRVEVSGAPAGEGQDPSRLARLQALEEELVARDRSLEEANARLTELEQSIRDLQRLVELRNQNLAQLQQQLAGGDPRTSDEPLPALDELLAEAPGESVEPAAVVVPSAVDAPEERADGVQEVPTAAQGVPATEAAPVVPPETEPAAVPAAVPPPAPTPIQQGPTPMPTFLQSVLQDPMMLAGGGSILVLLLLYAGYKVRRKRSDEEEGQLVSGLDAYPSEAHSVFGGKGGQSVDTGSSSVLHTDFSQSGLSAIDADEGVDPVAEADVYMAYGRDAQAEEILLDALKADGSRAAIYLKLLEIYAQRQSPRQFESVATDLYSRTGGANADWAKAAEMGRKLDPDNPLYQASSAIDAASGDGPPTELGRGTTGSGAGGGAVAGLAAAASGLAATAVPSDRARAADPLAEQALSSDSQLSDIDFSTSMPVAPSASQMKDTWTMPGDLSKLSQTLEDGSPEDVAKLVDSSGIDESAPGHEPDVDFSVLDFDLGDDVPATSSSSESEKQDVEALGANGTTDEGTARLQADNVGLSFDLDVGDAPTGTTAEDGVNEDALKQTMIGGDLVFDRPADQADSFAEFEIPEAMPKESTDPQTHAATVVGNAMDLASAERSLDREAGNAMPAGSASRPGNYDATVLEQDYLRDPDDAESVMDLEKTGFDNSLLDFDFDLGASADQRNADTPAMDFSTIDLDLELPEDAPAPGRAPEVSGATTAVPVNDAQSPELRQEIDTKLDLARAYEEMGDKDGARELIEEVLREGSSAQREVADRLLARLA